MNNADNDNLSSDNDSETERDLDDMTFTATTTQASRTQALESERVELSSDVVNNLKFNFLDTKIDCPDFDHFTAAQGRKY